jgi:hypothetical protein
MHAFLFSSKENKMKTKLYKNSLRLTALLLVLSLMPSGLGLAVSLRPEAAVPFEDDLTSREQIGLTLSFDRVMALTSLEVFQAGADRLAALQNDDGGWDWPLDDGNANNISPKNTVGPIGQGLALAYGFTGDPDHQAALADAGDLLLGKQYNFSPSDGYLAATLDEVFGVTTYTDHVKLYFYDPLANGTYDRNDADTNYDTPEYVNLIRTSRAGSQANLAAWDIGMGLVGAAAVGADTSAWIAGVKAEIDELNSSGWYDVIGLAGAIYGLAYVGEDYDPLAGSHEAASSLADLGAILAGYQLQSAGFTWNSGYLGEGENNETVQETAYAILALEELDPITYFAAIHSAGAYLKNAQLATGGWESYLGAGENNEITGEALWGIYAAYPYNPPPFAEANGPYMVAVEQSIALDPTGSSDPDDDPISYSWAVTGPALGSVSMESFTAGSAAGITEVTLTVTDDWGGTATDTAMVVIYDPDGGFVTGGGWIDSPAGAYYPDLPFYEGSFYEMLQLEVPLSRSEAQELAAGMTIADCTSAHLATITSQAEFDKVSELFIDDESAWLGGYQEEGVFPVDTGWQWVTGEPFEFTAWLPGEPNDSPFGEYGEAAEQQLAMHSTGWNDVPDGPSYSFVIEYEGCSVPTGKATFGFVSKYRRGATVPDGNTEFRFVAGDFKFSSTSYQWLVVNQGGENAQFKGYGTINSAGNYGFMLWAGDGTPDTFRIQIWDAATEVVVYDNGSDHPLGGGSVVIHKK